MIEDHPSQRDTRYCVNTAGPGGASGDK